jgi:hypothetical protein
MLYSLMERGELFYTRLGRRRLVPRRALIALAASGLRGGWRSRSGGQHAPAVPGQSASKIRDGRKRQDTESTSWFLCDALHAIAQDGPWCGTAGALLMYLQEWIQKRRRLLCGWPASADLLLRDLRAPQLIARLRRAGVNVTMFRRRNPSGPLIRVVGLEAPPASALPGEPCEQRPLFTAEDLAECACAAGGKRWR